MLTLRKKCALRVLFHFVAALAAMNKPLNMKNAFALALLWALFLTACHLGKKLPQRHDEPITKVLLSNEKTTELQVRVPRYKLQEVQTKEGVFQRLSPEHFPGGQLLFGNEYTSMPEIPMYTFLVALPLGAKPDIISIKPQGPSTVGNVRLYPIQPEEFASVEERKPVAFQFDPRTYKARAFAAGTFKTVTQVMSEPYNIYRVSIPAVDYDPEKLVLTWYDRIDIKIDYSALRPCFVYEMKSEKFALDAVDQHLQDGLDRIPALVVNPEVFVRYRCLEPFPPTFELGSQLLIVTDEKFVSAANDLKAHKESLGIRTRVVTTQQILASAGGTLTDVKIRNWIRNYNTTHVIRLKWVLIMGDAEYIPPHYIYIEENGSRCSGDQFYGQLTGDSLAIPTLGIGRLPVDSLSQAQRLVDRIKNYELHPPRMWNSFHSQMTFAAQFQDDDLNKIDDRWFAETSEDIRNYMLTLGYGVERVYAVDNAAIDPRYWNDGTPIPSALRKPGFPWDGDLTDIVNAINGGRVIVYHRDHGYKDGWGTPSFTTGDLSRIHISGTEYPFVFSINCASGVFDNETANLPGNKTTGMSVTPTAVYWAEKFLLQPNGAIGIIGDTRNSSTIMNNFMAKGLFDAIFPGYQTFGGADAIYHMGDVLNHAKAFVASTGSSTAAIYKENTIYNLFGDPSLRVVPNTVWRIFPGDLVFVEKKALRIPIKFEKPGCLKCPPPPFLSKEPIIVTLTNPRSGEVISRALMEKEGTVELPLTEYKGPAILRISGGAIEPTSMEVKL